MTTEHNADTCQHPDCSTYHHLEVSIDYCIALMEYWLTSAEAVTARMTQIME